MDNYSNEQEYINSPIEPTVYPARWYTLMSYVYDDTSETYNVPHKILGGFIND